MITLNPLILAGSPYYNKYPTYHGSQTDDNRYDEQAERILGQYDRNHNGFLNRREATRWFRDQVPLELTSRQRGKLYKTLAPKGMPLNVSRLEKFYQSADRNGDGKATRREQERFFYKLLKGLYAGESPKELSKQLQEDARTDYTPRGHNCCAKLLEALHALIGSPYGMSPAGNPNILGSYGKLLPPYGHNPHQLQGLHSLLPHLAQAPPQVPAPTGGW